MILTKSLHQWILAQLHHLIDQTVSPCQNGVYVTIVRLCHSKLRTYVAKKRNVSQRNRFMKLCIDPDVLELCIKNSADIKYDRENNSTRSFRKSAYRQYILDKYGYLGKGNRRVAPSCVVWKIRRHYPSTTGVYMGFKEH